jgi:hypothetical protein
MLKPQKNNEMFTTYELVIRILLAHPQYGDLGIPASEVTALHPPRTKKPRKRAAAAEAPRQTGQARSGRKTKGFMGIQRSEIHISEDLRNQNGASTMRNSM